MIIDTHAHLYYDNIKSHLPDVLHKATDIGIEKIIVPAIDLETSRKVSELSDKYEIIFASIGVHPCEVQNASNKDFDEIIKLSSHQKVVAIGETGLDYYWDLTFKDKQIEFFELQIDLATELKKPVVIHSRNAVDDAIEIVKRKSPESFSGHFHCLSGTFQNLAQILDLKNFYVSYCGNVTFKKFTEIDFVSNTPLDRILSETDSPFLAPVPFRGKVNEPAYIVHTIKKLAGIIGTGYQELLSAMYQNANKLYFKHSYES